MSAAFWQDQSVIVTGGAGFLGRHVLDKLRAESVGRIIAPRRADYDLREMESVARLYADHPDATMVIHLAANVGGIGINREHPGLFFYENLMMGTLLLEYARRAGVAQVRRHRHRLQLSQIRAGPLQRERSLVGIS